MIPRIIPRGLDEFKDFISGLKRNLRGIATEGVAEGLVGDQTKGLKHYSPYKYITRKRAYGKSFQSDKQRRYVMARIHDGTIEPGFPHRSGALQRGWKIIGKGVKTSITNDQRHAPYVMGDDTQSRHEAKAGWRKVGQVIKDNMANAIRHAEAKIHEYLERKGK